MKGTFEDLFATEVYIDKSEEGEMCRWWWAVIQWQCESLWFDHHRCMWWRGLSTWGDGTGLSGLVSGLILGDISGDLSEAGNVVICFSSAWTFERVCLRTWISTWCSLGWGVSEALLGESRSIATSRLYWSYNQLMTLQQQRAEWGEADTPLESPYCILQNLLKHSNNTNRIAHPRYTHNFPAQKANPIWNHNSQSAMFSFPMLFHKTSDQVTIPLKNKPYKSLITPSTTSLNILSP